MKATQAGTIRRTVALPAQLVAEAQELAPTELKSDLNRLVVVSLMQYLETRKAFAAERAMREMAADPQVQAECASIASDWAF